MHGGSVQTTGLGDMHGLGPFGATHRHRLERHARALVVDALGHVVGDPVSATRSCCIVSRSRIVTALAVERVEVDGDA